MSRIRKWSTRFGTALVLTAFAALPALAEPATVGDILEGAAGDIQTEITGLLPAVLGVGVFLLVIRVAWKFFKRMASG